MRTRGNFQGMLTIVRFNWPLYGVALAVMTTAGTGIFLVTGFLKVVSAIAFAGATYFIVVSLGVSHLIYDRSELYRWSWLGRALTGASVRQGIFCHSGFDETSADLREQLGNAEWVVLDHYDAERMTEPSIHRARALFPPTAGTFACNHDAWPPAAKPADVVFALLAIHELRAESERTAWFSEARRCLSEGGRIVLVEHVRNIANFLAFGPGFLHFHSCANWRRCWERAGLLCVNQFGITPFVQVFVLTAR